MSTKREKISDKDKHSFCPNCYNCICSYNCEVWSKVKTERVKEVLNTLYGVRQIQLDMYTTLTR